ncbi:hypothetical protein GCM10020001_060000 [Nonomuraea salmonea]
MIAAVATVALVAAVGLWGANRYVRLQQVEPASVAQENTDGIPTPSGTATGPAPQGTDPANPQATAEATVPWAASNDTNDVGPLVLPTEWSSATPDVPELTTAPTTPSALPTTPVVVPTQPPATVTKRAQPTKKQQKTQAPKPKATVTKTVQPTPKPTKTTPQGAGQDADEAARPDAHAGAGAAADEDDGQAPADEDHGQAGRAGQEPVHGRAGVRLRVLGAAVRLVLGRGDVPAVEQQHRPELRGHHQDGGRRQEHFDGCHP